MNNKRKKYLVFSGLIGCGVCCISLLFPAAIGVIGASIFGVSMLSLACGLILFLAALLIIGIYLKTRKPKCAVPAEK